MNEKIYGEIKRTLRGGRSYRVPPVEKLVSVDPDMNVRAGMRVGPERAIEDPQAVGFLRISLARALAFDTVGAAILVAWLNSDMNSPGVVWAALFSGIGLWLTRLALRAWCLLWSYPWAEWPAASEQLTVRGRFGYMGAGQMPRRFIILFGREPQSRQILIVSSATASEELNRAPGRLWVCGSPEKGGLVRSPIEPKYYSVFPRWWTYRSDVEEDLAVQFPHGDPADWPDPKLHSGPGTSPRNSRDFESAND